MQIKEIYAFLDELSPFELQESWDNSGLLVGKESDEVNQIYLSLDIDSALLKEVEPKSLIITHHPLIFKGLKKVDFSSFPSNLLQEMIKKDISLIAMHTNFDTSHLNRYVATKILGFDSIVCDGHICYIDMDMDMKDLYLHVKEKLQIKHLRCVDGGAKRVKRCALTTGSGGDLIGQVNAQCYLSGDFKYHQALEAKENKLSLIDIGHFESESHFSACLAENLKNFPLKVIMSNSKNPFEYK